MSAAFFSAAHDVAAAALFPLLDPCTTALRLRLASRNMSLAFALYAAGGGGGGGGGGGARITLRLSAFAAFRDPWRALRVFSKLVSYDCCCC
jgi:hypothetical protein